MQKPRCKRAACEISERSRERHACHARAPRPALRKTLRVPGEKADRAHGAKFEQGAFHPPIGEIAGHSGRQVTLRIGSGLRHSELTTNSDQSAVRIAQENRSEERRVGKECRSRWSPDH